MLKKEPETPYFLTGFRNKEYNKYEKFRYWHYCLPTLYESKGGNRLHG